MVTKQKITGRASSIPSGLAVGAMVSMGITLIIAVLLGKLVDSEAIPWQNVGYGVMILLFMASFLGSEAAVTRIKRQRLMVCVLSGMVYFGILLAITALFFGGQYEAVGETALMILAGSGTVGILGLRVNRGVKRRKSGVRYR